MTAEARHASEIYLMMLFMALRVPMNSRDVFQAQPKIQRGETSREDIGIKFGSYYTWP